MALQISLTGDEPLYQQIVDQVRFQVARGQLKPSDRLEPVRQLAARLEINASTVARAYQLLERDGIIETNRRRGSVVARGGDAVALRELRESRLRGIIERSLVEALGRGYTPEEIEAAFELHLAAWRERRRPTPTEEPAPHERAMTVRFVGSHDIALEALWAQARRQQPALQVTARYVGSLDGLLALYHGEADLAGAHIVDEETGEYNLPILRRLFPHHVLCVVTLAEREQGWIVPHGNPRRLHTWGDLAQPGLRFVNRQPGSGTRTLLDYHLSREGIATASITGYGTTANTHLAIAAAVAEGRADVGLGLYAAARAYGLDFVSLARERYDLALPERTRNRLPLGPIIDSIRNPDFRAVVAELGGYDTTHSGTEVSI